MNWRPTKGINLFHSPLTVIAAWAFLYAPRPFFLGLYHDDWVLRFDSPSWANTQDIFWLFANRPLQGLYLASVSWLAQGSTVALHFFSALLLLVAALALRRLLLVSASYALYDKPELGCNIAVLLWLMIPWSLGTTAWIISAPSLISIIGFCITGITLLKSWMGLQSLVPWLPLGILINALSHEMFILQTPLLLALYYIQPGRPLRSLPIKILPISAISAVFLCMALIIRSGLELLGGARTGGLKPVVKSFYPGWMTVFQGNLSGDWMVRAFQDYAVFAELSFITAVGLAAFVYLNTLKNNRSQFRVLFLVGLISVLGLVLSTLIPSLAGYGLSGYGLASRTSIGFNFWLSFWAAFIFITGLRDGRFSQRFSLLAGFILAVSFVSAMCIQLSTWAAVWKSQLYLLKNIDRSAIALLPGSSIVVLDRPVASKGVYGFSAEWDLSYALKGIAGDRQMPKIIVASDYWKVYNTGNKLVQRSGSNVLGEYPYSQAWVLSAPSGLLRPMRNYEVLGGVDFLLKSNKVHPR